MGIINISNQKGNTMKKSPASTWGSGRYYFFYSATQRLAQGQFTGLMAELPTFKGKEYTEMKSVGKGWSNHDDAVLLGIGTIEDVAHNLKGPLSIQFTKPAWMGDCFRLDPILTDRYYVGIDPYIGMYKSAAEIAFEAKWRAYNEWLKVHRPERFDKDDVYCASRRKCGKWRSWAQNMYFMDRLNDMQREQARKVEIGDLKLSDYIKWTRDHNIGSAYFTATQKPKSATDKFIEDYNEAMSHLASLTGIPASFLKPKVDYEKKYKELLSRIDWFRRSYEADFISAHPYSMNYRVTDARCKLIKRILNEQEP